MTAMIRSAEHERMGLWGLIEQAAQRWPDQPMLVSRQGDGATFGEYRERVLAMAAGLADLGIGRGDVVSWILPTWVDTVVLAGALSRLGAVQNPIIGIYRHREVGFCARQAGSKYLISPGMSSAASTTRPWPPRSSATWMDSARSPWVRARSLRMTRRRSRLRSRPSPVTCAGSATRRARPRTRRGPSTATRPSERSEARWPNASTFSPATATR